MTECLGIRDGGETGTGGRHALWAGETKMGLGSCVVILVPGSNLRVQTRREGGPRDPRTGVVQVMGRGLPG